MLSSFFFFFFFFFSLTSGLCDFSSCLFSISSSSLFPSSPTTRSRRLALTGHTPINHFTSFHFTSSHFSYISYYYPICILLFFVFLFLFLLPFPFSLTFTMSSFLPVNNTNHDTTVMDHPSTSLPSDSNRNSLPAPAASKRDLDSHNPSTTEYSTRPTTSDSNRHDSTTAPVPAPVDSDGSDNDHASSLRKDDHGPPSKKKKGQRFFCTDFPPCNLSFTRSEHLARHIRKHTGERPFQCHCGRRFSRLDNLRQHAQTVHINEDIPGDSLAATGSRSQRQIRSTDRVRPPGRSRAGTTGSQGGHSRGHSRNLSSSSITSNTSTSFGQPESRRRPPPLIMANDPTASRSRLAMDAMPETPSTPPAQIQGISAGGSPYTFTTPTGGSPQYASPISSVSQGFWDGRTHARRLSVPAIPNPFLQQQHVVTSAYTPSYVNGAGVFASPTSSHPSDVASMNAADAELRRRTWHPSSRPISNGGYIPAASYQTPAPETLQPAPSIGAAHGSSAEPPPRLPGIESFDKFLTERPLTPSTNTRTQMDVDSSRAQQQLPPQYSTAGSGFNYSKPSSRPAPPIPGGGHRRGQISLDSSLQRNLTGLNLGDKNEPPSSWGQQTIAEIQNVSSRPSPSYVHQPGGWYSGNGFATPATAPRQASRPSPEDSSGSEGIPTPSTASLEYHPAIVHSSGYVEPHRHLVPSDVAQPVSKMSQDFALYMG